MIDEQPSDSGGVELPSSAPAGEAGGTGASSAGTETGTRDGGVAGDDAQKLGPAEAASDEGEDGLIKPDKLKERAAARKIAPIPPSKSVRELAHQEAPRGPQKPGQQAAKPGDKPAVPGGQKPVLPAPGAPKQPTPGKILFNGHEYDSLDEIEQRHKSLEGQFKPLTQRLAQAEQAVASVESIGMQWKQLAEEREAKIAEYETKLGIRTPGAGAENGQASASADPLDVLIKGDDVFQELMKQGNTDVAMRHLVHTALTKQQEHFDAKLDAAIAPFREAQVMDQVGKQVSGLMIEAADLMAPGEDGTPQPVFPELHNEEGQAGVGRLWAHLSQGWSPEFAASPMGLYISTLVYRDQQAAMGGGQPATSTAPSAAHSTAAQANEVAARITREVMGGERHGGEVVLGGAPPSARAGGEGAEDSYRRAIRDSEPINPATGVPW